jgi:hypothetical protein
MNIDIINKVLKEDTLPRFLLLVEKTLDKMDPKYREGMLREPEENIAAGIDLLKYIAQGEGGDFSEEDIKHALKMWRYLYKLLLKAKPQIEDEIAAIGMAKQYTGK